jgi:hypothetical protein
MMKRLLIAGIAALFLATGAAHAYPANYYDSGIVFLKIQMGKGRAPSGRRVFPTEWTIVENWKVTQDHDGDAKEVPLNLRCPANGNCRFNGKLCRKMSDEEGKKEFPEED